MLPVYKGVEGNERADAYAKQTAARDQKDYSTYVTVYSSLTNRTRGARPHWQVDVTDCLWILKC